MASLILVLGLCSCGSAFGAAPPPGAPHRPSFLKAPTNVTKDSPKASSSPATNSTVKVVAKPHHNASIVSHHNATKLADDILHPKVEYDPETAALMAQADDAIKEAESVNNAPPKPAPKNPKAEKDAMENMGMIKALRGMVCNHKIKKHLSLCDMKDFQGAEIKSEVNQAAIPDPDSSTSASDSDTDSVASQADDLMAKVDSLQKSVGASVPEDAKSALLDVFKSAKSAVVHDAAQVAKKHTTGAEAVALMKNDVTAGLPASVRDTILSVMKDAKASAPAPKAKPDDVTAGLPASVRDTVLAVMKDAKH